MPQVRNYPGLSPLGRAMKIVDGGSVVEQISEAAQPVQQLPME
jgi:hypothetical protein